jgi:hypothetical protein
MRSGKVFFALLLCAGIPAWAQGPATPVPATSAAKPRGMCADCGVITSVRSLAKQEAAGSAAVRNPSNEAPPGAVDETKAPGLVASIPLGGGKPKVGSVTKVGNDAPAVTKTWEVIVRMDDGQYRVLTLESQPDYAKDDRVRIVDGKLTLPP